MASLQTLSWPQERILAKAGPQVRLTAARGTGAGAAALRSPEDSAQLAPPSLQKSSGGNRPEPRAFHQTPLNAQVPPDQVGRMWF